MAWDTSTDCSGALIATGVTPTHCGYTATRRGQEGLKQIPRNSERRGSVFTPCRAIARRDVQLRCTSRRLDALAFALRAPLRGGEGWTIRPAGESARKPIPFRRGRSPVEKPGRPSRTGRQSRPAPSGGAVSFGIATISVVTFLYSGHPALRPSGRLRRSHALLRMRGQAKKSDPASGRRSEARRPTGTTFGSQRARSPYR